jgi:hypothetical protein
MIQYVLPVEVPLKVLQSLAGTLNWLRNAAPNLHPTFGALRNAIMTCEGTRNASRLPDVARLELSFFGDFAEAWDGVNFFPECPRLLIGADEFGRWSPLPDFPAPVPGQSSCSSVECHHKRRRWSPGPIPQPLRLCFVLPSRSG